MKTIKKQARLAGVSYLLIILCGIFSHKIVRAGIIVQGDAVATSQRIIEKAFLFRMSIVSDFVMILSYFALGVLLYIIFRNINKNVAITLVLLNVVGTGIMALNMLNQHAAILILDGGSYLDVFSNSQLQALSLFFMNLHGYGYQIATISYGVWLFPIGYLGLKSGYFPKVINYLLMAGAVGYTVAFLSSFMMLSIPFEITLPADLGEFSLCLYLLIKGVNGNKIKAV